MTMAQPALVLSSPFGPSIASYGQERKEWVQPCTYKVHVVVVLGEREIWDWRENNCTIPVCVDSISLSGVRRSREL